MSEVLQIEQVFLNVRNPDTPQDSSCPNKALIHSPRNPSQVSKGQTAKAADLEKAFGTTDIPEVVKIILDKGELQVGGKEREQNLESMKKEIATGIAEKCVDPTTQRPHTVSMIEKALNEAHFNVLPSKSVKSQVSISSCSYGQTLSPQTQVLEAIKVLQEAKTIPIQRARMRIRLTMPAKDGKRIKDKVIPCVEKVEEEDWSEEWELVRRLGQYRNYKSTVADIFPSNRLG
jgi:ribosome maturation protein SDO1